MKIKFLFVMMMGCFLVNSAEAVLNSAKLCYQIRNYVTKNGSAGVFEGMLLEIGQGSSIDVVALEALSLQYQAISEKGEKHTDQMCRDALKDIDMPASEPKKTAASRDGFKAGQVGVAVEDAVAQAQAEGGASFLTASNKPDISPEVAGACKGKIPFQQCEQLGGVGLSSEVSRVVANFTNFALKEKSRYSAEDCFCFKKELKDSKREAIVGPESDFLRPEVEAAVRKEVGQKILNDLALLVEDGGFYLTTQAYMVTGEGEKSDTRNLCMDPKAYEKEIDTLCRKNGTSSGKDQRLADLMNSFGDNYTGKNFANDFDALVTDIRTVTIVKDANGKAMTQTSMSRRVFDDTRRGLIQDSWRTKFIHNALTVIALDPMAKEIFDREFHRGVDADEIFLKIATNTFENTFSPQTMNKLQEEMRPFEDFKFPLKSPEFRKNLRHTLKVALSNDPGLRRLMSDSDRFLDVVKEINEKKGALSVSKVIEEDKDRILGDFAGRCRTLQENLAQAVCDKDFMKSIEPKTMAKILQKQLINSKDKKEAYVNLICENANTSGKNDFKIHPILGRSDFHDKKTNFSNQTNSAALLLAQISTNSEMKKNVSSLVENTSANSVRAKILGIEKMVTDSFATLEPSKKDSKVATVAAAPTSTPTTVAQVKKETSIQSPPSYVPAINAPQFIAPINTGVESAPVVAPVASRSIASVGAAPVATADTGAKAVNGKSLLEQAPEVKLDYDKKISSPAITKEDVKEVKAFTDKVANINSSDELEKLKNQFSTDTKALNSKIDDLKSKLAFYENGRGVAGMTGGISGGSTGLLGGPEHKEMDERSEAIIAAAMKEFKPDGKIGSLTVVMADGQFKTRNDPSISEDVIKHLSKMEASAELLGQIQSKDFKFLYTVEEVDESGKKVQRQIEIRFKDLSIGAQEHIQNLFKLRLAESKTRVTELKTLVTLARIHQLAR